MSRSFKILVVLLVLVALPLRAVAAAVSLCEFGQQHEHAMTHDEPAHDHGGSHHHGAAGGEHCGSAVFAAAPPSVVPACLLSSERISGGERYAAGFVPDHLDPPPLAL